MKNKRKILVLGASGLIGSYMFNYLKNHGGDVIGTYNKNRKKGLIHFDIVTSTLENLPLNEIEYICFCSGIAKIEECSRDVEYSYKVNTDGLKKIMSHLPRGVGSMFISSASIFDGVKGGYKEEDEKNPISIYGKQRADVEDFMTSELDNFLIIRPGKIFGIEKGEGVLFRDWLDKYKNGEEIICADDEKMSPIYVEDLARGTFELLKRNSRGIYHLNPPENYSRYEMAQNFFDYLGIDYRKIITKCSIDDFDFIGKRPKNTYLDVSKFLKETRFKFTNLEECYELIKERVGL